MFLRYYDERYYLDENRKREISYLLESQKIWEDEMELEKQNYRTLISDYDSYIKIISKLVNELNCCKDNLSKLNIITKLMYNGIFSYENTFFKELDASSILQCKLGLNIVDGYGCCRHTAEFIQDVIPESKTLTCVTKCKKPFRKEANHMVNLAEYNGLVYAYDAYNGGALLKFDEDFRMIPLDETIKTYFSYKPYAEIIYYKRSLKEIRDFLELCKESRNSIITKDDENFLHALTCLSLDTKESKDMINDFKSDTRVQKDNIKEQIKEIKIKRIYA